MIDHPFFLIKRLGEKFEYCSSYINDQWKPSFAIFQNKQQVASVSWVHLEITTIFKWNTYIRCSLAIFAAECHLTFTLVPCALVKGLAHVKCWNVHMKWCCSVRMADILHAMKTYAIYIQKKTNSSLYRNFLNDLYLVSKINMYVNGWTKNTNQWK